jgi:hypothetical protein
MDFQRYTNLNFPLDFLHKILSPQVGNRLRTLHTINTGNPPSTRRLLVSFDVVSLFTNVPVEEVLQIIRNRLSMDSSFPERSPLQAEDVMELLDICLTATYSQYYI